ncbi:bifunctional polyketide synthase/nonribosomal peptide synthetase phmA [Apiospora arundinis]|uniref:Bifunctional polyketide synthase/nonribosomal peptide synthetase phmA n=1 Tax=Apiospora arundinis TaxID=335852 RepID=A0ABR2IGY7_9PEZI
MEIPREFQCSINLASNGALSNESRLAATEDYSAVHLDLAQPRLGLGEDEAQLLLVDADTIIHSAADFSFLKAYEALRNVSVGSTRELRGSLHRSDALRVTASVGAVLIVAVGSDDLGVVPVLEPESLAGHRADSVDGYIASKRVSKVLFEKAAGQIGLPVRIYRPSRITWPNAPTLDIVHSILIISREMGTLPNMTGWSGSFDFVSAGKVADEVVRGIKEAPKPGAPDYSHPAGELVVPVTDIVKYLEREKGYRYHEVDRATWVQKVGSEHSMSELVAGYLSQILEEGGMSIFPRLRSMAGI